ncbi:hypothetical protein EC973_006540 [Apophysomyces ossiformis]|uniref:DDE-1 domain-containing protein n=1 Tax=Apophysomyces ossiformis TaxID=679940 RepID=A0A8H7EJS4_9FUNG|nr:hypothetical protein EC973_006540 [Apophysomyces ossiformis]
MIARKRKVVLVLDNFAGHYVEYEPSNVELLFLPLNTTLHTQPLDGRIIHTFKAHYKRYQFDKAYRHIGMIQIGCQDKEATIFKTFLDKSNNEFTQTMVKEHSKLEKKLQDSITNIVKTGKVAPEDCPSPKVETAYECNMIHPYLTEDEILAMVEEKEDEESSENEQETAAENEPYVPEKIQLSTSKKVSCLNTLFSILDDEEQLDPKIFFMLPGLKKMQNRF